MFPDFRLPAPKGLVFCLLLMVFAGAALGTPQEAGGSSCKMSLVQGYVEVRRARFAAALERFEEALAGGGDCLPEAHLGLATAYNSKNDHKRALKAAETALLYSEDREVLAAVHYQIGLVYDQRGPRLTKKKALAKAAFERALELSDGEHSGAIRAVFRISKETKDTVRLAELEARYPGVQVATRAEQRRAVRPKKPVPGVESSQAESAADRTLPSSVLATVGEGQIFDCSTGLMIESVDEQKILQDLVDSTSHVGGDIKKPEKVRTPSAQYPEAARKAKIQGVVIAQTVIDTEGAVRLIRVLKGLSEGLNRAAVNAICRWEFEPARTEDGKAVAVYYNLTMNFRVQ